MHSHIPGRKYSSVYFSAQTSFKRVGNTNIAILNQKGSCSIARHRPRDPVSEPVTETNAWRSGETFQFFPWKKEQEKFLPHQRLHAESDCTCIKGLLLLPWNYYISADLPMVPTFRHVFHGRKFQVAFASKTTTFFFNNKKQIIKTFRINHSQILVSKWKQFW